MRTFWLWLLTAMLAAPGTMLVAQEPARAPRDAVDPSATEQAAAKLLAATVTVRISEPAEEAAAEEPAEGVSVCSGVSLGDGLVVTFVSAPEKTRFRITLADGEQADGRLRVTDRYSGLTLLEIEQQDQPRLEPAAELPKVGGAVLTAAAAGIEQPLVSRGILGGTERTLGQTGLPPMLQCDVRTTGTSSGAAVVDLQGRLIGIVAATGTPGEKLGWTYAVPVRHVQRLVRARAEDQVVVLKERRPVLGLTLGAGDEAGTVRVERVIDKGPAEQAGIERGDLVLEVDGVKVRSVYQVQRLVMKKQPGDRMEFALGNGEAERKVRVTLGGGFASAPNDVRVGPLVIASRSRRNRITVQNLAVESEEEDGPGELEAELKAKAQQIARLKAEAAEREKTYQQNVELLQRQLGEFGAVIRAMQAQLKRRDAQQAEIDEVVKELNAEVKRLRRQLNGEPDAAKGEGEKDAPGTGDRERE